jgi:hypothetical protein
MTFGSLLSGVWFRYTGVFWDQQGCISENVFKYQAVECLMPFSHRLPCYKSIMMKKPLNTTNL